MAWTGSPDAPPSARIAALMPTLQPSERRVAEAIVADVTRAVETTAQELAADVGVGRASVVRTAQTLGYDGYPQLRVALARERVFESPVATPEGRALSVVTGAIDRHVRAIAHTSAALADETVEDFVTALDGARRVVIAASGLSAPLGMDAALRLATVGRPAEYLPDALAQSISARQLGEGGVLLAISGSGTSRATLSAADAARAGGAEVLAVTGFARSALVERAHHTLVVPPPTESFQDELLQTSRVAMALVVEALVEALAVRRGAHTRDLRSAVLSEVSKSLGE